MSRLFISERTFEFASVRMHGEPSAIALGKDDMSTTTPTNEESLKDGGNPTLTTIASVHIKEEPRPMALEKENMPTITPADDGGIEHGQSATLTTKEWAELDDVAEEGFTQSDQRDMQRMGKSQQFRRNFKLLTTIGFTTCVMGTWKILLTSKHPRTSRRRSL